MSEDITSPFIPMSVAFIGMGIALLMAIPFVGDRIGILADLGSALFLISLGSICAYFARKKGEYQQLLALIKRRGKNR